MMSEWTGRGLVVFAALSTILLTFGWCPRVFEAGRVTDRDLFMLSGYVFFIAAGCMFIGARAKNPF